MFIGTLYPLFIEAITGDKISVGAPFFDLTFGPLMLPLLVVVPFGPLLAWKRGDVFAVGAAPDAAFGGACWRRWSCCCSSTAPRCLRRSASGLRPGWCSAR